MYNRASRTAKTHPTGRVPLLRAPCTAPVFIVRPQLMHGRLHVAGIVIVNRKAANRDATGDQHAVPVVNGLAG